LTAAFTRLIIPRRRRGDGIPAVPGAVACSGITINGLSLEILPDKKKDWRVGPTTSYYAAHVIGGPGALLLTAHGMEAFEETLKRKLSYELVARKE
jgi:hypothetical protein